MWEDAIASKAPWVTITSWNEWHEGSDIDVSVEYGDFFLNRTKIYSDQLKTN